jgi:hypothetical protein
VQMVSQPKTMSYQHSWSTRKAAQRKIFFVLAKRDLESDPDFFTCKKDAQCVLWS